MNHFQIKKAILPSSISAWAEIRGPQNGYSTRESQGSNLNLRWDKCGIWLVNQWVSTSFCALVCSITDCTLIALDIIILDACLVIIFIWDIAMLIDYLACLSIVTLILPWLLCSPHMYRLIIIYLLTWCVDSLARILSWSSLSMLSLTLFTLIVIFLLSLCVDIVDIFALCLTACCMTTLFLCDCMSLVCVDRTSIPLPPTLWFRSLPSFWFSLLQVWGLVCVCFFDRVRD